MSHVGADNPPPYTPEHSQELALAAARAANSAVLLSALRNDVQTCTSMSKEISSLFLSIISKLVAIDDHYKHVGDQRFSDDWRLLFERYQDTMARSKACAAALSSYVKGFDVFLQVFDPSSGTSLTGEMKLKVVGSYTARADRIHGRKDACRRGWTTFIAALNAFQIKFSPFAAQHVSLTHNLDSIQKEIDSQRDIRNKAQDQIVRHTAAMGCTSLRAIFGDASALSSGNDSSLFLPAFSAELIISLLTTSILNSVQDLEGLIVMKQNAETKLRVADEARTALLPQLDEIGRINVRLHKMVSELVPDLTVRLRNFDMIVKCIQTECTELSDWIREGEPVEALPNVVSVERSGTQTLYGTLTTALEYFVSGV